MTELIFLSCVALYILIGSIFNGYLRKDNTFDKNGWAEDFVFSCVWPLFIVILVGYKFGNWMHK